MRPFSVQVISQFLDLKWAFNEKVKMHSSRDEISQKPQKETIDRKNVRREERFSGKIFNRKVSSQLDDGRKDFLI